MLGNCSIRYAVPQRCTAYRLQKGRITKYITTIVWILCLSGCHESENDPQPEIRPLDSVLFVGDSYSWGISASKTNAIGYSRAVEMLEPPFAVHRLNHTAVGSSYQVMLTKGSSFYSIEGELVEHWAEKNLYLQKVLEEVQPDAVFMNACAWDLPGFYRGIWGTTPEDYERNLKAIFAYYEGLELEIFFALGPHIIPELFDGYNAQVDERNAIASAVCNLYNVNTFDPNAWEQDFVFHDSIHLDNESYSLLASEIINQIRSLD